MLIEDVRKLSPWERLIYWIRERESVRLKKEGGEPAPWTDDTILQSYRFCNVRRMDDKVSRWLMENWYVPFFGHKNMVTAVALARFVNKPESLSRITPYMFRNGPANWGQIKAVLRWQMAAGKSVFNAAYMVRGNSQDSPDKIGTVVDEYVGGIVSKPVRIDPSSMQESHRRLSARYGFGSFMAGQVVADLRWAIPGKWEDRETFAPLGPGSKRGMNILHNRPIEAAITQERFGEELTTMMDRCRKELPKEITGRLEAIDYQNCLCEISGYEKVLWGRGRKKQRYKGDGNG